MELLTHSRLATCRACPRKHYLRYEAGLRTETTSQALSVGSAFHAAQEARDKGLDILEAIEAHTEDPYDRELVAAMFMGHFKRHENEWLDVVKSEMEFALPLINPETGRASRTWELAGKLDRLVRLPDGRLALQEYKTTTKDITPGSDYWTALHMDGQLSLYVIAARQMGYEVETVLYDVTRRPLLRPYKETPLEARKYKKDGTLYANQRDRDETPEEYGDRVAKDIAERPDYYFARIEIARLDDDLDECRKELWQQQVMIRQMQRTGAWWRNPGSCFSPHSCEYLPICKMDNLQESTPSGYVRSDVQHPELTGDAVSAG